MSRGPAPFLQCSITIVDDSRLRVAAWLLYFEATTGSSLLRSEPKAERRAGTASVPRFGRGRRFRALDSERRRRLDRLSSCDPITSLSFHVLAKVTTHALRVLNAHQSASWAFGSSAWSKKTLSGITTILFTYINLDGRHEPGDEYKKVDRIRPAVVDRNK